MPPANDVGIGLTRGGVVELGTPSCDGGGVVAGEELLLLGGDLLLERSSLQNNITLATLLAQITIQETFIEFVSANDKNFSLYFFLFVLILILTMVQWNYFSMK